MTPLRIAHVVEATTGGVARHVIDLVTQLDPAEATCHLYLSFERQDSWRDALRGLGVPVREIPMARLPGRAAAEAIAHAAAADGIDLLHLHSAKAGYHGRLAVERMDRPPRVVYTPHAFAFQRTDTWFAPLYRRIERKLAPLADRIICVSPGERAAAVAAGISPKRIALVPNGIDPLVWTPVSAAERDEARHLLGIETEAVLIGAMGRLVSQKGYDILLQAVEELVSDLPRVRVCLWGSGPMRPALSRMVRRFGLRGRVRFCGPTGNPRLAYAAMDVFCAPSRWEAGPYAVLEAMACGLPVVATDVPGNADYLADEATGLLAAPDLPGGLEGALRRMAVDPDVRADYGAAGRRRLEACFTLERMVSATAEVYRRVMG